MKRMKRYLTMILSVVLLFNFTACGAKNGTETKTDNTETKTDAGKEEAGKDGNTDPYIFTDSAGRKVEVPMSIDRLAPSGTLAQLVLFALAPDKFVGLASNWSEDTTEFLDSKYLDLPTFGQFYGSEDLNMEALSAADPQIIIDIGEAKGSIAEDMDSIQEQIGIPTIFIEASTEKMSDCYRMLGELLGLENEAQVLADYCDEIYNLMTDTMNEIGEENKADILYCLGDAGNSVIAQGSFHAEIIDLLTNNLAVVEDPSSKGSGNEVSMEQIYNWNPDYIIFAPDSIYDTAGNDAAWISLDAIAAGRYYEVPCGPYNWMGFPPSVNRYMGMLWLGKLLYPEYFSYDLYEEAVRYYELFYHCELSREQFEILMVSALPKT